jgi:predicted XRE-type DNA-binding protein
VDNEVRDRIIVELAQGKDGLDPMNQEEIARIMGISQQRVSQVITNLLGASNFVKDKNKVKEAIRLYLQGLSQAKIGERFGVTQQTISNVVRDYMKRKDLISAHLKASGHLKSVVEYRDRGPWGDAKFNGNCSGYLLVDLFNYFEPKRVLDPAEGSGTTGDVCFDLGDIPYTGLDLRNGFNLVKDEIPEAGEYDFIFFHPPYWNAIKFEDAQKDLPHPDNLSLCKTYDNFLEKLKICITKLYEALKDGGYLAILYGDGRHNGIYYPTHSHIISMNIGELESTIIKYRREDIERSRFFDYGSAKFIPTIHEYVLVFQKR